MRLADEAWWKAHNMKTQNKSVKIPSLVIAMLLAYPGVSGAQNENAKNFPPQQINAGSKIYAQTCLPCHGVRMADPEGLSTYASFRGMDTNAL